MRRTPEPGFCAVPPGRAGKPYCCDTPKPAAYGNSKSQPNSEEKHPVGERHQAQSLVTRIHRDLRMILETCTAHPESTQRLVKFTTRHQAPVLQWFAHNTPEESSIEPMGSRILPRTLGSSGFCSKDLESPLHRAGNCTVRGQRW